MYIYVYLSLPSFRALCKVKSGTQRMMGIKTSPPTRRVAETPVRSSLWGDRSKFGKSSSGVIMQHQSCPRTCY